MITSMSADDFILGVNYWPRRKAMRWWSEFDPGEVRGEFDLIAQLGLRMVRIFLLWEDWQPQPEVVSPQALDDLQQVCEIADEKGLQLNVTFFTGHMSGPSWVPEWMLRPNLPVPRRVRQVVSRRRAVEHGYVNPFTDPGVLAACELLLRTVVMRFKDHPAIALWNLGNEPDLFAWPPSSAVGRSWVRRMTAVIREIDPGHPVTCGLHTANLVEDNGLRVHEVFAETDLAVMHGYPMYADWAAGPLDPDFVPFSCALTSALCGKPTLMEEFGGCTAPPGQPSFVWRWSSYGRPRRQFMASEQELAEYVERVLPKLVEVGALGALLWCFADYAPELHDAPPCDQSWHERYFGLVRPDGSLKPHAAVIQRFAASHPRVAASRWQGAPEIDPEAYYQAPLANAKLAYRRYLDSVSRER